MGDNGAVAPGDCSTAAPFVLDAGTLQLDGEFVSTNPGVPFELFAPSPATGSITTTLNIVDGVLVWDNAAFFNGSAVFYADGANQIYATFAGPTDVPPGSSPIVLLAYSGKFSI